MTKNRSLFQFVLGILLCIVCVVSAAVLGYSAAESAAEKARLEAMGATVNIKLTAIFFIDAAIFAISGILGITFAAKNAGAKFNNAALKSTPLKVNPIPENETEEDILESDVFSEDEHKTEAVNHFEEKKRGVIIRACSH